MIAVKENKQIRVSEEETEKYVKLGYDICEERDGTLKLVKAGAGKAVPYAEYVRVMEELEELKAGAGKRGKPPADTPLGGDGK